MPAPQPASVRLAVAAITGVLVALSAFQLALILGAPLGSAAWGGGHEVLPVSLRIGSAFSIAIYALILWAIRRRVAKPESRPFRIAAWTFGAYFTLGILLNLASSSPWERFLMAPVAAVLAASCFVVASRAR